jgi:hypothetical protein
MRSSPGVFELGYCVQLSLGFFRVLFQLRLGALPFLEQCENAYRQRIIVDRSLPLNDVLMGIH